MDDRTKFRLKDIIDTIDQISALLVGKSYQDLVKDKVVKAAFERFLEIVSEAAAALDVRGPRPLREVLHAKEREEIEKALKATNGARMKAADLLGISRKVLWEKIKEHGLGEPGDASAET